MTVRDALADLYGVPPPEFLARRKELVAAARKRGDADGAKRIGAARRPTTAAWVVNVLVRADRTVGSRLDELRERLRAAHAAMDGTMIRQLSTAQRKLVDELAGAAFAAADVTRPSAALYDDVVGTLQAAVADPDVTARLGRLERAERWSGFGDFDTVAAVGPAPKTRARSTRTSTPKAGGESRRSEAELSAARSRVASARAEAAAAQEAAAGAAESLSDRTAELATARRRYEKVLETLSAAEREVAATEGEVTAAERTSSEAAARMAATTAALRDAERDMASPDPPADASRQR